MMSMKIKKVRGPAEESALHPTFNTELLGHGMRPLDHQQSMKKFETEERRKTSP